jgi:hypothetical protein
MSDPSQRGSLLKPSAKPPPYIQTITGFAPGETGAYILTLRQSSLSPAGGGGVLDHATTCACGIPSWTASCWIQAGPYFDTSRKLVHGVGVEGGWKRTGDAAKGTPRNLLMGNLPSDKDVATPTITPESIVAVGEV